MNLFPPRCSSVDASGSAALDVPVVVGLVHDHAPSEAIGLLIATTLGVCWLVGPTSPAVRWSDGSATTTPVRTQPRHCSWRSDLINGHAS